MKKKLCALTLTLLLLFAFSANCFAAVSPTGRVLPDKEHQTNGNGGGGYDDDNKKDNSSTSPKTGMSEIILVGATAFIITASCVAYVASKKRQEDEW